MAYVDVDDAELAEYSALAESVKSGGRLPAVLVGDEVRHPESIGIFWLEEQLRSLGVDTHASSSLGKRS